MHTFITDLQAGDEVPYNGEVRSAASLWLGVGVAGRLLYHSPSGHGQSPWAGGARGLLDDSSSCVGEFSWIGDTDSWSAIPQPDDFNYTV